MRWYIASAFALFVSSCGRGGEPAPEYDATGLWEIVRVLVNVPGVSWVTDTASIYSRGRHFFLFDDDGSYRWLQCQNDGCAIRETGTFRIGHDTLWLDVPFANSRFFLMEREAASGGIFLYDSQDGSIPSRYAPRSVLSLSEIRDVRSFRASGLDGYASEVYIPASRLSTYPNAIAFERLVGQYETSGGGDTVRYDCLWDVRADSTIVEYISRGDVRYRRTYRFQIKWDPEDYSDTITLVTKDMVVRRLQYLGDKRGGGADIRGNVPYEWYRLYDLRDRNSPMQDLANELLSRTDYADE